jgi:hypothetical protein
MHCTEQFWFKQFWIASVAFVQASLFAFVQLAPPSAHVHSQTLEALPSCDAQLP